MKYVMKDGKGRYFTGIGWSKDINKAEIYGASNKAFMLGEHGEHEVRVNIVEALCPPAEAVPIPLTTAMPRPYQSLLISPAAMRASAKRGRQ